MAVYPYYTSPYAISWAKMQANAVYIWAHMRLDNGDPWTRESVAAMLGNMEHESGINPGRWQSGRVGDLKAGYSLVQWTPASKYIDWCRGRGLKPEQMPSAIDRINYEYDNPSVQWSPNAGAEYGIEYMSFSTFKHSTGDVGYLAKMFAIKYERSKAIQLNPNGTSAEERAAKAVYWYSYIGGHVTEDPDEDPVIVINPPYVPTKKKFPFIYYMKGRTRK